MEWCQEEFKLLKANKNGGTDKDHKEALIKMGAIPDDRKVIPKDAEYLLNLFYRLRKGRPIEFQEVAAFCDLMAVKLMPWEIDSIMTIDSILENSYAAN